MTPDPFHSVGHQKGWMSEQMCYAKHYKSRLYRHRRVSFNKEPEWVLLNQIPESDVFCQSAPRLDMAGASLSVIWKAMQYLRMEQGHAKKNTLFTVLFAVIVKKYYITASFVQYEYKILCILLYFINKEFVSVLPVLESAIFLSCYNIVLFSFWPSLRALAQRAPGFLGSLLHVHFCLWSIPLFFQLCCIHSFCIFWT